MPRAAIILCILCSFASPALHAQSIVFYKCVSPSGAVSYQQAPCSGKDKAAWSRDIPPAAGPSHAVPKTAAEAAREKEAQEAARRARLAKQAAAAAAAKPVKDTRSPQQKRCDDANVARDAWERQVGGAPDLDRLSVLNNDIFEACKGL